MRRRLLLIPLALAALVAGACAPMPDGAPAFNVCPTAAAGQVQVAVVVDNAPAATRVVCVVVPAGSNGLDALAARATRIGAVAPRVEGGFVCGIDGIPAAPECAPSTPDGFRYWSYWIGDTSWSEALVGAGSRTMTQGAVEGWVFGTWDFATTFPGAPSLPSSFDALTD